MMETVQQVIATMAVSLAPVFAAIAARLVTRWLKMEEDQALRDTLEKALQAGAGVAYINAARGVPMDTAVQMGTAYVATRVPETLAKVGAPGGNLAGMIEGRLGALLAADPTVQGPRS
jgi:hypothetical protein